MLTFQRQEQKVSKIGQESSGFDGDKQPRENKPETNRACRGGGRKRLPREGGRPVRREQKVARGLAPGAGVSLPGRGNSQRHVLRRGWRWPALEQTHGEQQERSQRAPGWSQEFRGVRIV